MKRRDFLKAASLPALAPLAGQTANVDNPDPIKLGSILDVSGMFGLYGRPMDKAVTLAIEQINERGGLLGRKVQKVAYDTRSVLDSYPDLARQITTVDKVDVVHAGILSASREAIRPVLRDSETLYFYNVQYEGGVCDRNTFCTGVTPAQQAAVLVPECMRKWGDSIYVVAADYNYGHITARWLSHYAEKTGGKVLQTDYFDLGTNDFSAAIDNIRALEPDMVISVLVGAPHLSFYRQWEVAGMKSKIPMASTTMGAGNEHVALTREEGDGIRTVYAHSKDLDSPANRTFMQRWQKRFGHTDDLHELAVATYQGVHLWATGVRKAGSIERDKVIAALEDNVSLFGPTGKVSIDPATHHCSTEVHLLEVNNHRMEVLESFEQLPPADTQLVCDLASNPDENQQFEIKI